MQRSCAWHDVCIGKPDSHDGMQVKSVVFQRQVASFRHVDMSKLYRQSILHTADGDVRHEQSAPVSHVDVSGKSVQARSHVSESGFHWHSVSFVHAPRVK
jgi:hypothetical protein